MVSLSSGLQQFVSNSYLVTPDSTGTSATSENGLSQLSALAGQLQSTAKSQVSTSSSSSAQLAEDTYTSSTQSQTVQSSSTSSKASSSSTVSSTSSSQGSQGDTVTLAGLIQNQTISGSSAVRQVLLAAIEPYENGNAVKAAWDEIGTKVTSGDYSGALTALGNYTTELTNADYDTSLVKNPVDALKSALQGDNQADVQTAFTAFTSSTPESVFDASSLLFTGDVQAYASSSEQVAPGLTDQLQKIGYTASNAAAEANAIILGTMVDDATITVNSAATTDLSSQVDQSISDLAKSAANSSDSNLLSSIIASMAQANSVTSMESTLTQLASQYGDGSQGASTDNADKNSDGSIYA